MQRLWYLGALIVLLAAPTLACGSNVAQVTPTPTKTPRMIRTLEPLAPAADTGDSPLPTSTSTPELLPTDTPIPEPTPTETPVPVPPTETPTPEPPPTDTPVPPPPPPTNTPVPPPPPPTNTPAPPPPTPVPANNGPQIVIELPSGDKYNKGDDVRFIISVSDSSGVKNFEWGIFDATGTGLKNGNKSCDNRTDCSTEQEFNAVLDGAFQIGVKAFDSGGVQSIEIKQIYVGG